MELVRARNGMAIPVKLTDLSKIIGKVAQKNFQLPLSSKADGQYGLVL